VWDQPPLTVEEILSRMMAADAARQASFSGYTAVRRYRFENKRFNKRAEVGVKVVCDKSGAKTFEVLDQSGSAFVRSRIIGRMIDAERDASRKNEFQQTRIIPQNYEFRLLGLEPAVARAEYVMEITPKTPNRYLVRGKIWVDAGDFAITRVEGKPARNPSIWIRSVQIVHRYEHVGNLWLPASNRSHAEARVFGPTDVQIDYSGYVLTNVDNAKEQLPSASR